MIMSMNIGLSGSSGRVNKEIIKIAHRRNFCVFIADKTSFPSTLEKVFQSNLDVFIDFSQAQAWPLIAHMSQTYKVPLISGTTGVQTLEADLKRLSNHIPVLHAKNFSLGIHLLKQFLRSLDILFDDINIEESHHKLKRDSPSGTAIDICQLLNVDPRKVKVTRRGEIIGDHEVSLKFDEQELKVVHRAFSRKMFALGAMRVVPWLLTKKKGTYTLENYLKEVKSCPLDIQ